MAVCLRLTQFVKLFATWEVDLTKADCGGNIGREYMLGVVLV